MRTRSGRISAQNSKGKGAALSVFALAAATLMLESGLLRLLAVAQYYHFAFLVVSLALLGLGAGGSLLTARPDFLRQPLENLLSRCGWAFLLASGAAYAAANLIPFDSYTIAWQRVQVLYFVLYYTALALPFLVVGTALAAALAHPEYPSHRIYAANLAGSALGAGLGLVVQGFTGVAGVVLSSALLGLLPVLQSVSRPKSRWLVRGLFIAGAPLLAFLAWQNVQGKAPLGLRVSPYKALPSLMRHPQARWIFGRWNAYSRIDVLADTGSRQWPGLSYAYPQVPPPQHSLTLDAGARQPIVLEDMSRHEALAYLPESLAFTLQPGGPVLVLEPGGGLGVWQALAGGASQVTVALGNPLVLQAVATTAPQGNPYNHSQVDVHFETGRTFLHRSRARYDIVYLPLTDPYRPVTNGAYSLSETYLLTKEALVEMLRLLEPDGLLVLSRWIQMPPSEGVRLVATVVEALETLGHSQPGKAFVAYRGIQTLTVVVRPQGWSDEDLKDIRQWLIQRRFDLVWAPNLSIQEVNRFNRLESPVYYQTIRDLLTASDRQDFYRQYPFAIAPATDDRPFFHHFFTWAQTSDVLATLGKTWQPFGGSGYFVLFLFLALALLLGTVLVVGPILWVHRKGGVRLDKPGWVLGYFGLLGLAFLFVEIPLIQRWILLLGHPAYAFAAVVTVLLLAAGWGSLLARKVPPRPTTWGILILLGVVTPYLTQALMPLFLSWPVLFRVVGGGLLLTPLGVVMGMPFPWGLAILEKAHPESIPWAWAINGWSSVMASVLAALLALSWGFSAVLYLGAGAYLLAAVFYVWRKR